MHGIRQRIADPLPLAFPEDKAFEVDARDELRVRRRMHVGANAADTRPYGNEIGQTASKLMHVQRHLDLARQRRRQGNQQRGVAGVLDGHPGGRRQHDDQRDDAADRTPALTRQNRPDLRDHGVTHPLAKIPVPEGEVVTVAAENVVPGIVGPRPHAVGHALVMQEGGGERLLQQPLQRDEDDEHGGKGNRQAGVYFEAKYQRVEKQLEEQPQVVLQVVDQIETDIEGLIGQERFDLLACPAIGQQGRPRAVAAREIEHVARIGREARPLREDPAHRACDVGDGLDNNDLDEVPRRNVLLGNVARDLNDQPGGRRTARFLDDDQDQHAKGSRTHEIAQEVSWLKGRRRRHANWPVNR